MPWHTQYLADQLTLFQPGGIDYTHLITTGTPGFSDLPTALILEKINENYFLGTKQVKSSMELWAALELVCCKKRQKIVPDQLLVCGLGDLWRTWRFPSWFLMTKLFPWSSWISLVPFRTFKGPLFPKPVCSNWSGTIFCRFLKQTGSYKDSSPSDLYVMVFLETTTFARLLFCQCFLVCMHSYVVVHKVGK